MTTARAVASRQRNERGVESMFFCMLTSRSFLPAGTPHGQRKVGVRNNCFPPENWICCQAHAVLSIHHNPAPGIQWKPSYCSAHRARESQPARGIQKQQHVLPDVVTLTVSPKSRPLVDGQNLSRRNAAQGTVHLKGNGRGSSSLSRRYWDSPDRGNAAGEDHPGGLYDSLESKGARSKWG